MQTSPDECMMSQVMQLAQLQSHYRWASAMHAFKCSLLLMPCRGGLYGCYSSIAGCTMSMGCFSEAWHT